MKNLLMALGTAAMLVSTPVLADDRNPDLIDRLGRALQNNDSSRDRDRSQNYGSSGYDRRDDGRDYNRRDYSGRDRDEVRRQRQLDDEQRDLDRRRQNDRYYGR